jgi:benzoyl-CoA reductase/2-hydroxyglutaryl-CoA dehydratase subunit BcrC/BadD/HgdB
MKMNLDNIKCKEIVAFTSTVPIEIIFASQKFPLDLNNIFVSSKNPNKFIDIAEMKGFPRNFCAWTKGLYGVISKNKKNINKIIAVMEGDCSSNKSLFEFLDVENSKNNIKIIPFSYPFDKNPNILKNNIEYLMNQFNVNWDNLMLVHKNLNRIRKKILKLENLFDKVSKLDFLDLDIESKKIFFRLKNLDLHIWQVSCSDFMGDYEKFERDFDEFWIKNNFECLYKKIENIKNKKNSDILRLGFVGVPTIIPEIYDFIDKKYKNKVKVIFNETQREFVFLKNIFKEEDYKTKEVFIEKYINQYLEYSYPYSINYRLKNIQ